MEGKEKSVLGHVGGTVQRVAFFLFTPSAISRVSKVTKRISLPDGSGRVCSTL